MCWKAFKTNSALWFIANVFERRTFLMLCMYWKSIKTSKYSVSWKISFRRKKKRIRNFWNNTRLYTRVLSLIWKVLTSFYVKRVNFRPSLTKAVRGGLANVTETLSKRHLCIPRSKTPFSLDCGDKVQTSLSGWSFHRLLLVSELCPDLVVWLILCKLIHPFLSTL